MSRQNKKNHNNNSTIINNTEIDYDKLAEAIIRANTKLKEQDKIESTKHTQDKEKEWNKIIGLKDYPDNENIFKRKFHDIINDVSLFLHIIFFKEKNAKYDVVTFGLLRLATVSLFNICKCFLYILAIILFIMTFFTISDKVWIFNFQPSYLLYGFITFFLSRIFRVASFEIKNITDRNYLIGILSATTCFFAMIVAIAALFKG